MPPPLNILFFTLYFSDHFVMLLNSIWFRMKKMLSVLSFFGGHSVSVKIEKLNIGI